MNKITLKEIKTTVEKSGYLMEQELLPRIERFGYFVTPNHNFMDQDTGISREIDIHAIGGQQISRGKFDFIFPVILTECKNNETPFIFFTHDYIFKGILSLNDALISGLPKEIEDKNKELISLCDFLKMYKFHHHAQIERISTQFCKITRNGQRLEANQEMVYDKIVVPLIKAVDSEIKNHFKPKEVISEEEEINLQIYYPLIILSGQLYEWYIRKGRNHLRPVKHVVFLRNYETRMIKGEFKIDVITKDYLNTYLKIIDREIFQIKQRIKRNVKRLRNEVRRECRVILEKRKNRINKPYQFKLK